MGSNCIDGAVFHNNDAIRILHGADPLGNNNRGGIRQIAAKRLTDATIGSSIDSAGTVI